MGSQMTIFVILAGLGLRDDVVLTDADYALG